MLSRGVRERVGIFEVCLIESVRFEGIKVMSLMVIGEDNRTYQLAR